MDKIRVVSLGGLDEFYKSCLCIEINDDIFVVECGLKFPDVTKPGIDYVIARSDYLVENKHRIKAYFLTIGYDTIFGGLPYIYSKAPAPVYLSNITKALLDMFATHNKINISNIDFKIVNPTSDLIISGHKISLFSTCTNVANSFGIAFDTDQGNIIYINNNVFDNNKDTGFALDIAQISKISASKQTLLLINETQYATKSGYTNPKYRILPLVQRTLTHAQGRIIAALDAPDVYNITALLHEAAHLGRKILIYDQSSQDLIDVLIRTNCLKLTKNNFIPMGEVNRVRAQEVLILITGFGSKLFHKVSLLANHQNDDQIMRVLPSDTFILATHAQDEAEIDETNTLNDLYHTDCNIVHCSAKTFLKMHSSEEDLKTLLAVFRPRYFIPYNGTIVDLFAAAKIALGMNIGLSHNSVFVLDNGMIIEFDNYFAKILPNKIITGNVYVDSRGLGDFNSTVLEERQRLSDDGVIIIGVTISKSKREIVLGPDIQSRGLVFVKENDSLMKEIEKVLLTNIKLELSKANYSISYMEMTIKEQIFKTIRRAILKSPTIIPIIVEIE